MIPLRITGVRKELLPSLSLEKQALMFPDAMNGTIEKIVIELGEGDHSLLEMNFVTDIGEQVLRFKPMHQSLRTWVFYPRTVAHDTEGRVMAENQGIPYAGKIMHVGNVRVEFQGLQDGETVEMIELYYS